MKIEITRIWTIAPRNFSYLKALEDIVDEQTRDFITNKFYTRLRKQITLRLDPWTQLVNVNYIIKLDYAPSSENDSTLYTEVTPKSMVARIVCSVDGNQL